MTSHKNTIEDEEITNMLVILEKILKKYKKTLKSFAECF